LLLKLFFGGQVGAEVSQAHVEAALASEEKTLAVYEATERAIKAVHPGQSAASLLALYSEPGAA
jgi:hypothetical protein